jgi:hypothetical protein
MSMARSTRSGTGVGPGNLQEMAPGKTRGVLRHYRHSFGLLFGFGLVFLRFRLRPKAARRRFDPRMAHAGQVSYPPQAERAGGQTMGSDQTISFAG